MDAAPVNDMGVMLLFAEWARKNRVRIQSVEASQAACIAIVTAAVKAGGKEEVRRIALMFQSSEFRAKRRSCRGIDWIVCWEHDWTECPERVTVIDLRRAHGLGFNVWVQPVSDDTKERYSSALAAVPSRCEWSVARQAHVGDLVVVYHSTPRREIGDIFRIVSQVRTRRAPKRGFPWNARERDWCADLVRVARLGSPVTLAHLKAQPELRDAWWLRNRLVSRAKVTVDWIFLRALIVARNPALERRLPLADGALPGGEVRPRACHGARVI